MSETSDPDYWLSLHPFEEEEPQEADGNEAQEMEVDQSHMAVNDEEGVPDTNAVTDDATVDDRIHDLELARRREEHIRQRSGELMYESNNLEIAIGQVLQQEPYASGQLIENAVIERLYAQHAPHLPLPGRSDYQEQLWVGYGPYGQPRFCILENGAPGPQMVARF